MSVTCLFDAQEANEHDGRNPWTALAMVKHPMFVEVLKLFYQRFVEAPEV